MKITKSKFKENHEQDLQRETKSCMKIAVETKVGFWGFIFLFCTKGFVTFTLIATPSQISNTLWILINNLNKAGVVKDIPDV